MIKIEDYNKAKNIIKSAKEVIKLYENQQEVIKNGAIIDINLIEVLSNRPRWKLIDNNKREYFSDNDQIINASDIAKFLKEKGDIHYLLKLRDFGRKSNEEVMKYVTPFL